MPTKFRELTTSLFAGIVMLFIFIIVIAILVICTGQEGKTIDIFFNDNMDLIGIIFILILWSEMIIYYIVNKVKK